MSTRRSIWLRNWKLWAPTLAFILVNLLFLAAYRLVLAEEAEIGSGLLARRTDELERLTQRRRQLEEVREHTRASELALQSFYSERLATEDRMLTQIIAEVKELAQKAGLAPTAIRYQKEELEEHNLIKRTITFGVDGDYRQLRKFINFLELSHSFLILEEIGLRGDEQPTPTLRISLRLSTLFAEGSGAASETVLPEGEEESEPGAS
jgi:Tfp pilus assembly protein PilO